MALRTLAAVCTVAWMVGVSLPAQQPEGTSPIRIFIRAGEKTHGAGGNSLHDYPAFLGSWSTILKDRGAVVDGALHFPSDEELAATDVLINYKGDGGTCSPAERRALEAFLKEGKGIISLHDGMCADDAAWYASIAGGAKQHGERNSSSGLVKVAFQDRSHEITQGIPDFELDDEAFYGLTTTPEMHVLATAPIPSSGEVVPQIWTAERTLPGGKTHRSFVYMLGHRMENFANPHVETLLLRAIAWAGRRPINVLTDAPPPPARGGGRRGGGGGRAGQPAEPN